MYCHNRSLIRDLLVTTPYTCLLIQKEPVLFTPVHIRTYLILWLLPSPCIHLEAMVPTILQHVVESMF